MDNEPDIWSDGNRAVLTLKFILPMTGCAEYKDKSVAISLAVKNVDPNAQMLGPVSYGFGGYLTFQGAPDWKAPLSTGYSWFLDYYLDKMEANSVVAANGSSMPSMSTGILRHRIAPLYLWQQDYK